MIYIWLNLLPILAAAAIGLGAGLAFRAVSGLPAPRSVSHLLTVFASQAWLAAVLAGALILAPGKAGAWTMALGSAAIIWIGFVVPATIVMLRARSEPLRTVAAEGGYWLLVMLAQAVTLHLIGLAPPPYG